ncbi:hypothetical protein HAZT_HAZT006547 [Hyalella azteca]|uniref:Uncharacterized protein n=1 Tax=Hyalella azteca TaxID=294128 RepID=A0A6A0H160_HYAAZ|nr:hypothetical protein HAZT_HAZT006547 [Hyalella azteca]
MECRYEDATVSCGGKFYPVHRIVLSGCSSYFEQIFALMHDKHPMIVLKDITCDVFEALLSYMYVGRVEVKKENLGELINAAACLEIKGLAVSEEYEGVSAINSSASEGMAGLKRKGDHLHDLHDDSDDSSQFPKVKRIPSINFEESVCGKERSNLITKGHDEAQEEFSVNNMESVQEELHDYAIVCEDEDDDSIVTTQEYDVKFEAEESHEVLSQESCSQSRASAAIFDFEASTSDAERAEMMEAESNQHELRSLKLFDKKRPDHQTDGQGGSSECSAVSTPRVAGECEENAHGLPVYTENGPASNTSYASDNVDTSISFDIYSMLDLHYDDATNNKEVDFSSMLLKGFASVPGADSLTSQKSPILRQQWQCPQCDYSTPVKQYITQHIRRHTGEKPFKCNLCDYRAAQKQSVTYHMRRHTGEKPFKCPHCTYCSSSRQNLDRHVRRHTGEMPYGCPYCSYRSITKGPVVDHMRAKHGELECDKSLVLKLEAKNEGSSIT